MKRRQFVNAGLIAAGAGILRASPALAQSKEIVVTNWGGDWNNRTVKFIEGPLLEQKGYQIVRDLNEGPQRRTKIAAERRLPRGSIDVAHVPIADAFFLNNNEAIELLDFKKIPNAAQLVEGVGTPYFLPWLYSSFELLYNPNKVDAPTSWADFWNPKYAGRVGINNSLYTDYIQMASLLETGTLQDFERAKKRLLELKKAVSPKFYPGQQHLGSALKSEEVWIAANYRARALQWQSDGIPVNPAFPKEGCGMQIYGAVVPRRAPHKENAYTYLNALLDPAGLAGLCEVNFYAPASKAAVLSGAGAAKIKYSPEQQAKLKRPDFEYLAANEGKWLEWWNKELTTG